MWIAKIKFNPTSVFYGIEKIDTCIAKENKKTLVLFIN